MKKNVFWSAYKVIGHSFLGLTALAISFFSAGCSDSPKTVAEFANQYEKKINESLANPKNAFRKYVEDDHVTVDVKEAYVSDLKIETKDGSNNTGEGGHNIRKIKMNITTKWDGFFHKDGTTVLGILIENVGGKFKITEQKIVKTDALIHDLEFWFNAGWIVGVLLATL